MNVLVQDDEVLNVFKGQVASFVLRLVKVRANGEVIAYVPSEGITGIT